MPLRFVPCRAVPLWGGGGKDALCHGTPTVLRAVSYASTKILCHTSTGLLAPCLRSRFSNLGGASADWLATGRERLSFPKLAHEVYIGYNQ